MSTHTATLKELLLSTGAELIPEGSLLAAGSIHSVIVQVPDGWTLWIRHSGRGTHSSAKKVRRGTLGKGGGQALG